jgi:hypothetical protein
VWNGKDYARLEDLQRIIQHVQGVSREHCVAVLSPPPNAFWKFRERSGQRKSVQRVHGLLSQDQRECESQGKVHLQPSDKLRPQPPLLLACSLFRFMLTSASFLTSRFLCKLYPVTAKPLPTPCPRCRLSRTLTRAAAHFSHSDPTSFLQ